MDKRLIIVVPPQNKGWILDTMAQKIAQYSSVQTDVIYNYDHIPTDSTVLVMHYSLLPIISALNPQLTNIGCLFTHESANISKYINHLNRCVSIVVPNDREFDKLSKAGVTAPMCIVPEGDDPDYWKSHRRTERSILISQGFYQRKNPDLILKVIEAMPERKFILLGKSWEQYERFNDMKNLKNLEIKMNVPYDEYPKIYSECDIYFSASTVEGGGPHSLIEAMMCNMVPVVSKTGNYREYIIHTYNGFYFDPIKTNLDIITTMINIAYTLDTDVSKTVKGFTWKSFSNDIVESLFQNPTSEDSNESI